MENTLGKRIAANRKRLELTQEQLADRLGITAQAVSKWENDQSCPDINILPTLADIFGISTDELLGRSQSRSIEEAPNDTFNNDSDCQEQERKVHINFSVDNSKKRSRKEKLFVFTGAALFLMVGILYLLSKILGWECSLWDILWPSSLLVFGVFGLIGNISLFWLACTAVGAFFLVTNIIPLPVEPDRGILWALIIIVCGVMLLLDALRKKRRHKVHYSDRAPSHEYRVADNFLECSNAFGSERQIVTTELLTGGNISNTFGEYTVDLSGVDAVSVGCAIEASCSFGELEILVPKHYTITHKTNRSFSGFDVTGNPDEFPAGEIYLNATVRFGQLTIRYI